MRRCTRENRRKSDDSKRMCEIHQERPEVVSEEIFMRFSVEMNWWRVIDFYPKIQQEKNTSDTYPILPREKYV
jgi:hypothetical protein